jgi:hypothetical protein
MTQRLVKLAEIYYLCTCNTKSALAFGINTHICRVRNRALE